MISEPMSRRFVRRVKVVCWSALERSKGNRKQCIALGRKIVL